jgi:hypothetical protein
VVNVVKNPDPARPVPDCRGCRRSLCFSIATFGTTGDLSRLPRRAVGLAVDFGNLSSKFHHLQRTLLPVMPPADNQMAFLRIMHVLLEIFAFIFKFNPYALPLAGLNFPVGLAVRKGRLYLRKGDKFLIAGLH